MPFEGKRSDERSGADREGAPLSPSRLLGVNRPQLLEVGLGDIHRAVAQPATSERQNASQARREGQRVSICA